LLLMLDRVPGLRAIWLNGQRLTIPDHDQGPLEIPIDRLAERNKLVLDVEPSPYPPGDSGQSPPWGEIVLAIRPEPGQ
jgi:hypothetical protein